MTEIFNPSPTGPVGVKSDAFNLPRFSNVTPVNMSLFKELPGSDDHESTGLGTDTSGSGSFNYGMIGDWLNAASGVVTSIWGSSDKYVADMYQNMYAQEKKTTNLMIGIVVAVVLLAFVFLIIKKK
jgi:hypothetical protein